jgi:cytochrome c-type biogenesis protein CcmH
LAHELRCLVCQNQTLADSEADLAIDLRNEIRSMMVKGASDKQVVDYLVQRYGDFVMYRPPVKSTTLALWFGPFILMILGSGLLIYYLRRLPARANNAPLSKAEHEQLDAVLSQAKKDDNA